MKDPVVSVVIAAYNAEDYIGAAIASILNQTVRELELIVVNDGSTDSTRDVLHQFESDPRLHVIDQDNTGCSAARNRGAEYASGRFIALADADDVSWPERLECQLRKFRRDPTLGLVGTCARYIDHQGRHLGVVRTPTDHATIKGVMKSTIAFCHASIMLPREIFISTGGYDARFPTSEDYELLCRLVERYRAANVGKVLYDMRFHGSNKSTRMLEQHILRGLLTRHLITTDEKELLDDSKNFEDAVCRDQLIELGVSANKIDRKIVSNYMHRARMLARIDELEMAQQLVDRGRDYAEQYSLGDWARWKVDATKALLSIKNRNLTEGIRATTAALQFDPVGTGREFYKAVRHVAHRWYTERTLAGRAPSSASPPDKQIR